MNDKSKKGRVKPGPPADQRLRENKKAAKAQDTAKKSPIARRGKPL